MSFITIFTESMPTIGTVLHLRWTTQLYSLISLMVTFIYFLEMALLPFNSGLLLLAYSWVAVSFVTVGPRQPDCAAWTKVICYVFCGNSTQAVPAESLLPIYLATQTLIFAVALSESITQGQGSVLQSSKCFTVGGYDIPNNLCPN